MLNILLIGSGAREHALAKAIANSKSKYKLICFASANNPGIAKLCASIICLDLNNVGLIVQQAKKYKIDLAVCGPEAPLANGVMDALSQEDIKIVGPTSKLAQLESSKGYTRDLWSKYNINAAPSYYKFDENCDRNKLASVLENMHPDYVVKADGLMGGKGVKVFAEHLHNNQQALEYCEQIFAAGQPLVIEEKLVGVEFSLISLTDGVSFVHLPAVQDHKRAYDGDIGPNTGGMGSYSDSNGLLPFLSQQNVNDAQKLNELTVNAIKQETGEMFCGFLYGGFMLTKQGVKLIEYNVRFGDPEAVNLIPLIQTDWVELLLAMANQNLKNVNLKIKKLATVCLYVVPKGYPESPQKSLICLSQQLSPETVDNNFFIGAVSEETQNSGDKLWIMTGSRAIAVLGVGDNISNAQKMAAELVSKISGEIFYRTDIGTDKLIAERIELANSLNLNPNQNKLIKFAILGSTNGSILPDLFELLDKLKNNQNDKDFEVKLVISNKADAKILQKAQDLNLNTQVILSKDVSRNEFAKKLDQLLQEYDIDYLLLVGFMRILAKDFCNKWNKKVLNIHPSLLPKHQGLMDLAVHQAVLDELKDNINSNSVIGQTGCSVHWVSEQVDCGPVVTQKIVDVFAQDTPEVLKSRVQAQEASCYLNAIIKILRS